MIHIRVARGLKPASILHGNMVLDNSSLLFENLRKLSYRVNVAENIFFVSFQFIVYNIGTTL